MKITREKQNKLIEVVPDDGYLLKDESDNIFEGLCMRDNGETDEDIKLIYQEITVEEAQKYIEVIE